MGAVNFEVIAYTENAREAFRNAVERARWEYGHGGYTGTIAEKDGFVDFSDRVPVEAREAAIKSISAWKPDGVPAPVEGVSDYVLKQMADAYEDKWGPAVCLCTQEETAKGKRFWFGGMASC